MHGILRCKMCGGALQLDVEKKTAVCDSCGNEQTMPTLEDEKKANFYDRANHFRQMGEFYRALEFYEEVLKLDSKDADVYWAMVLCRFGITYVEEPKNHRRVPTITCLQEESILDDEYYKKAIACGNYYQRRIFERDAAIIDRIQKNILALSKTEEPYDIFLCYKENNHIGKRTQDSVAAEDLCHQLTAEGFRVFYAKISLEDRLGEEYEPIIFGALDSAKIMIVLGTDKEYFQSVWMKNEWSRFLRLINQGQKKTLIPAYKDIDPYDLPTEFASLQALDMGKVGFISDLVRIVKKILPPKLKDDGNGGLYKTGGNNTAAIMLERARIDIQAGVYDNVDAYCEKVLNRDPENSEAYYLKLLAEFKTNDFAELAHNYIIITSSANYQRAKKFANQYVKGQLRKLDNEIAKIASKRGFDRDRMLEEQQERDALERLEQKKLREREYQQRLSVQKTEEKMKSMTDDTDDEISQSELLALDMEEKARIKIMENIRYQAGIRNTDNSEVGSYESESRKIDDFEGNSKRMYSPEGHGKNYLLWGAVAVAVVVILFLVGK